MQTQTAVPTAPDFLFTRANPDQNAAEEDQSNEKQPEEVAAQQPHVSHGDTVGADETVPAEK